MTTTAPTTPFTRLLGHAFAGGAIAAVANVALYFGALAAGVTMTGEFQPGTLGTLPVAPVAISSIVPGLFAAGVAAALQRFTKAPSRVFTIVSVVFCLLSLGGPAGVPQIGTGTLVVMELMHVVAAIGIAGGVLRAMKA